MNRGLGLLEVVLPRGGGEGGDGILPAGRRDDSGFWYPARFATPGDIFTPQQRRLQARQREVQRRRRRPRVAFPAAGAAAAAPGAPGDRAVPLPAPIPEAGGSGPPGRGRPRPTFRDQLLPPPSDPPARVAPRPPLPRLPLVVDSRRSSE